MTKPLTFAVMMATVAFSQQVYAKQTSQLPVTDLDTMQFGEEISLDELTGFDLDDTTTLTAKKEVVNTQVRPSIFKPQEKSFEAQVSEAERIKVEEAFKAAEREYIRSKMAEAEAKKTQKLKEQQEKMKAEAEAKAKALAEQQAKQAKTEKTTVKVTKAEPVAKPVEKPSVTGKVVGGGKTVSDDTIKNLQHKNGKVYKTTNLSTYAKKVNSAVWTPDMKRNTAMTVKLQALLDWNHASPGPVDGGWGMNSKKALSNFQSMKGLPVTGKMNQATWDALSRKFKAKNQPVLMSYKITPKDTKYFYTKIPRGYPAKSKLKALNYQTIQEKLAEEFHMNINYLKKLNKGKKFVAGETITVYNPGKQLKSRITKVIVNKKNETLRAYNGNKLVATYPTTVGSTETPSPHGKFKVANRVKRPHYKATVEKEGEEKKIYMLQPGPNSPVGIVWMGLSKPSFGIHGSPFPEGISRQASHGCIRLTNWDALEVHANIKPGATVILE